MKSNVSFFAKIREKSKIFTLVPKYMHYFYVENKCMLIHETKIANMINNIRKRIWISL